MTLKELFTGITNHDIYEMYIWAAWFFDSKRISCIDCIETRALSSGKPPECSKCIPPSNIIKKRFKNSGKGDTK